MSVRVAVVGLGWAATAIWLPRLAHHPELTLTAVVDPSPRARAEFVAEQGAAVPVLDDVARLDPVGVDLVVVATPNHLHCAVACGLLDAGAAVFVEKPVCLTVAEALRLQVAEQAGPGLLLGGSAARYRADVRAFAGLVPGLGPLRHLDLTWTRSCGVPGADWFTDRARSGGGAMVDLGWHLLDVATSLIGTPALTGVTGTTSSDFLAGGVGRAGWRRDRTGDDTAGPSGAADGPVAGAVGSAVEDTARLLLVTAGGVSVSLRVSWASHEPYDTTTLTAEGAAGAATLTTTFGFSPERHPRPGLLVTANGDRTPVAVAAEPVGAEYGRQLDDLPALLADPTCRGRTAREARWAAEVVQRVYVPARGNVDLSGSRPGGAA